MFLSYAKDIFLTVLAATAVDNHDMPRLANLLISSYERLRQAREIADSLRHDAELHALAMKAVFALEDCYEGLVRARDETRDHRRDGIGESAP